MLSRLSRHNIQSWVLTGGISIEIQVLRRGSAATHRNLNDLDFVTASFESIPRDLKRDFLFRHVHPLDPPGKTILQAVDVEEALRIDVFSDGGVASKRAETIVLSGTQISIISFEDLIARAARLSLDITHGAAITKHAQDFCRLSNLTSTDSVEVVWQDHRRKDHPSTFREAHELLHDLIPRSRELLFTPKYSKDETKICERCSATSHFPLADPGTIYSILGYC